jgi:hypothetical protein
MATDNSLLRASENFVSSERALRGNLTSQAFAARIAERQANYAHTLGKEMVKFTHDLNSRQNQQVAKLSLLTESFKNAKDPHNQLRFAKQLEEELGVSGFSTQPEKAIDLINGMSKIKDPKLQQAYFEDNILNNPEFKATEYGKNFINTYTMEQQLPALVSEIGGDIAENKNLLPNLTKLMAYATNEKAQGITTPLINAIFSKLGVSQKPLTNAEVAGFLSKNSEYVSNLIGVDDTDRAVILNATNDATLKALHKMGMLSTAQMNAYKPIKIPEPSEGEKKEGTSRGFIEWLTGSVESKAPESGLDDLGGGEDIQEGGITPFVRGFGEAHQRAKNSPANPLYKGGTVTPTPNRGEKPTKAKPLTPQEEADAFFRGE